MIENVENLIREPLRRFQATLERIERDLRELTTRPTETHTAVLGLRRDQVNDAELAAYLQVQLGTVKDRLGRIERRLDLAN